MTELIYQTDSYIQEFSARVARVDGENNAIILDRTAFYPGGGGQPADSGTIKINGDLLPVKKAHKAGPDVLHIIDGQFDAPEVGQEVIGQLDWERRYQLMRTHTAMHILCGVIFRDYGSSVTGGSMEPMAGRMDFEFETMRKELVQDIDRAINAEVANARPLSVDILPREEAFQIPDLIRTKINLLPEGIQEVRVVEIEGLDLQADGGTHVANTREAGTILIPDYKSKDRINKRLLLNIED